VTAQILYLVYGTHSYVRMSPAPTVESLSLRAGFLGGSGCSVPILVLVSLFLIDVF